MKRPAKTKKPPKGVSKPVPAAADSAHNARADDEAAAVWVEIDSLAPWAENPRKNDANVARVAKSIQRLGWGAPIVARKADREIIAGHTRWKAAKQLGLPRVPVRFVDLDPADARLLALADNRLNELSPWDIAGLQAILSEFGLEDVELAGWNSDDLEKMAKDLLGAAGEDEEADDQSDKAKTDFAVLVECADEQEQLHVIAKLENLGMRCRALV